MVTRRYDFVTGIESDSTPSPTDAIYIPVGTTAQRPTPGAGERAMRYNTTDTAFEHWNGTSWAVVSLVAPIAYSSLADASALSVLGRSANSTGANASIAAGTDGHILRRSGTTLGFGTVVGNMVGLATDAVQGTINYYKTSDESMTFTFNGTGSPGNHTTTSRITRIGNIVTFHMGLYRATSGTGSTYMSSATGIPAWARPIREVLFVGANVRNNGASDSTKAGVVQIQPDGDVFILRDLSATAFTDGTSCGLHICYSCSWAIE